MIYPKQMISTDREMLVADALTHFGQYPMLRRMRARPYAAKNYLRAEIVAAGRQGAGARGTGVELRPL